MPHQCTSCGKIFEDASEELLKGCGCGSKFFYYIKQERLEEIKAQRSKEIKQIIDNLEKADKVQIEKDIREITGMDNEPEKPVILDLESVRVIRPGKFEIDVVNLFNKKRPLIYKLEEGKYIIDLASSFKVNKDEIAKKIRDPGAIKTTNEIDRKTIFEEEPTKTQSENEEALKEKANEGWIQEEDKGEEETDEGNEEENENDSDDEDSEEEEDLEEEKEDEAKNEGIEEEEENNDEKDGEEKKE